MTIIFRQSIKIDTKYLSKLVIPMPYSTKYLKVSIEVPGIAILTFIGKYKMIKPIDILRFCRRAPIGGRGGNTL